MSDPVIPNELILDLLEGREPDEQAMRQLLEILERDPRALDELKSLLTVEDLLAQRGHDDRSPAAFLDSLRIRLHAESDGPRFVSQTADLIRRDLAHRHPRHLPARLLHLRRESSGQFWALAAMVLIGTGVVIGFLAGLALDSGRESPAPGPIATTQESPRDLGRRPAPRTAPEPVIVQTPEPEIPDPMVNPPAPPLAEVPPPPFPPAPVPGNDAPPAPAPVAAAVELAHVMDARGVRLFRNGIGMDASDQTLLEGDLLMSGSEPNALALIRYADGTTVQLSPDSTCEIQIGRNESKQIGLRSGTLRFTVAKQPTGSPFRVETPEGAFRVVGTVFDIERGQGLSRLTVEEGAVHATRRMDGKGLTIRAGFTTLVSDFEPMVIRPVEVREPAVPPTPADDDPAVRVERFVLIDCSTARPVPGYETLTDGMLINLASLPTQRVTIFIETRPIEVRQVMIDFNGQKGFRREISLPYSLTTNDPGTNFYQPWTPAPGEYTLTATPYTGPPSALVAGRPLTIRLKIQDTARRP